MGVHKYASQEIVCHYQAWSPNTEEDSKAFVEQVINDAYQHPRSRFVFAIDYRDEMVGAVELNIRDFTNSAGEISYIVHPEFWGKGIATEVAKLLIGYGFSELNLHRIYATCDLRNISSTKVLEKVGMVFEGKLRENLFINDHWRDSLLYSVLEYEWN